MVSVLTKKQLDSHAQVEKRTKTKCFSASDYYVLNQSVAIVRHADRLDQTPEWLNSSERDRYPSDTPLTQQGHTNSCDAGKSLSEIAQEKQTPFALIVSSPYLRCAQTASHISRILGIPVQFDLDLGEVFHADLCTDGQPVHRSKEELQEALQEDFPDVEYIKDESGSLQIRGKQPQYPEHVVKARLRFCHKVQELVMTSTSKLSSIIIVTHGDSLAAVTGLLRPSWLLKKVPYTGYVVASRQVKVFDASKKKELQKPVYGKGAQWTIDMGPGFEVELNESYAERNRRDETALSDKSESLKTEQSANSLSALSRNSCTDLASTMIECSGSPKDAKTQAVMLVRNLSERRLLRGTSTQEDAGQNSSQEQHVC